MRRQRSSDYTKITNKCHAPPPSAGHNGKIETMELQELIFTAISGYHGSAIAEQFNCTFDESEAFEDQNGNAIRYIHGFCTRLVDSCLLQDEYEDELRDYLGRIEEYLIKQIS